MPFTRRRRLQLELGDLQGTDGALPAVFWGTFGLNMGIGVGMNMLLQGLGADRS